MTEDAFRLTPIDIRRYDFGSALRGYDRLRVDEFRNQVADEMERLLRVNQEIEAKAKGFHEQLRAFRERDKALNEALISAQQLRSETREQAEREAQLIVREGQAERDRLVDSARGEVQKLEADISTLERARQAFIMQLRMLAERYLAELAAMEASVAGKDSDAPPAEGAPRSALKTPAWLESLIKE
jgi:DivIVA domain-containing protein